jgi:hypothetical protein
MARLPAHAGMWRAAEDTADDLMARLAVVPMVLEARGLDVTPGMIDIFRKAMTDPEDGAAAPQAVAAMEVIYAEEVHHVAYGSKWFHFLCGRGRTSIPNRPSTPGAALFPRRAQTALQRGKTRRGGAAAGLLLAAGGRRRLRALTRRPGRRWAERLRSAPADRRILAQILSNGCQNACDRVVC